MAETPLEMTGSSKHAHHLQQARIALRKAEELLPLSAQDPEDTITHQRSRRSAAQEILARKRTRPTQAKRADQSPSHSRLPKKRRLSGESFLPTGIATAGRMERFDKQAQTGLGAGTGGSAIAGHEAAEQPDEDENEEMWAGEDDEAKMEKMMATFNARYPQFSNDSAAIWNSYDLDKGDPTATLDLSHDDTCSRISIAWVDACSIVALDGPPNDVLRKAREAKRTQGLARCQDSMPFLTWLYKSAGVSKETTVIKLGVSYTELRSAAAEGRLGLDSRSIISAYKRPPFQFTGARLERMRALVRGLLRARGMLE